MYSVAFIPKICFDQVQPTCNVGSIWKWRNPKSQRVGAIKNQLIMKPKKLNLKDLNVKSFVTAFEEDKHETVKGGGSALCTFPDFCTIADWCPTGLGGLCTRQDICTG